MRANVIIALVIVFFALSLTSRIAGLYTYWWFGIFRPHDWGGAALSELRIPLIAALLLVVPAALENKFPKINNPIAFLMMLMLVALAVADILNGCGAFLRIRIATVLSLFVLFYISLLSIEIADTKKKLFWLIGIIAFSIAFHSGKAGINSLLSGGASSYGTSSLSGLFTGSNAFALGSGMLLFFMIFTYQFIGSSSMYKNASRWHRPIILKMVKSLLIILIIGTIYNIISLESRGSFIATSLGLVLWVILHKRNIRMLVAASMVVALALSVVPLPDSFKDRMSSAFVETEELDESAASRPHFWGAAVDMVAVHPLGVGPGCFPEHYPQFDSSDGYYGKFRSVHSSHFGILADAGYTGFFIWVMLFLVAYWKLFKIRRLIKRGIKEENNAKYYTDISSMLLCTMTVFMIGGSFYEYAYNDIIWLVFALIIAVERNIDKDMKIR